MAIVVSVPHQGEKSVGFSLTAANLGSLSGDWDVSPHPTYDFLPWQVRTTVVNGIDSLVAWYVTRSFASLGVRSYNEWLGFRNHIPSHEYRMPGLPPHTSRYRVYDDLMQSTGLLQRIQFTLNPMSAVDRMSRNIPGENNVSHLSLMGAVRAGMSPGSHDPGMEDGSSLSQWGFTSPPRKNLTTVVEAVEYDISEGSYGELVTASLHSDRPPGWWGIGSVLDAISSNTAIPGWNLYATGTATSNWSNVYQNKLDKITSSLQIANEEGFSQVYTGEYVCQSWATGARPTGPAPNNWARFWITYETRISWGKPPGRRWIHSSTSEPFVFTLVVSQVANLHTIEYGSTVPAGDKTILNAYKGEYRRNISMPLSPILTVTPSVGVGSSAELVRGLNNPVYASPVGIRGVTSPTITEQLADQFRKYKPDLRAFAALSAKAGMDNLFGTLSNNWLESASEMMALGKLLPMDSIKTLYRLLLNPTSLYTLHGAGRLLDLASTSRLWWSFGAAPNRDAIAEVLEKADSILDRARRFPKRSVFHGVAKSPLHGPSIGNLSDMGIEARSKLVFETDIKGLLLNLLIGRSLGILPTLSNGWDLVPFSFIVDSVLKIGDRLDDVETRIGGVCLPLSYMVNSIKVRGGMPASWYEANNLSLSGFSESDDPVCIYYDRWVTQFYPPIREGAFDLHVPSFSPGMGITGGALAWSLLR